MLGPENLLPAWRAKPPLDKLRFFHFNVSAKSFHEADLITYTQPGLAKEIVIKDTYSIRK